MSIPCPQRTCCEQSAGSSIVCCLGPWEQGEPLGLTALEELSSQAPCVGELSVASSIVVVGGGIMKTLESFGVPRGAVKPVSTSFSSSLRCS